MYEKHRDEAETYEFDFAERLVSGETIAAPQVTVSERVAGAFVDRTSEFRTAAPFVVGTRVQFTLIAAAQASHQASPRNYTIYLKVTTSQGRILVGTALLEVTALGVVGAS